MPCTTELCTFPLEQFRPPTPCFSCVFWFLKIYYFGSGRSMTLQELRNAHPNTTALPKGCTDAGNASAVCLQTPAAHQHIFCWVHISHTMAGLPKVPCNSPIIYYYALCMFPASLTDWFLLLASADLILPQPLLLLVCQKNLKENIYYNFNFKL